MSAEENLVCEPNTLCAHTTGRCARTSITSDQNAKQLTRNVFGNHSCCLERMILASKFVRRRFVARWMRKACTEPRWEKFSLIDYLLQYDVLSQVVFPTTLPAHRAALQLLHGPGEIVYLFIFIDEHTSTFTNREWHTTLHCNVRSKRGQDRGNRARAFACQQRGTAQISERAPANAQGAEAVPTRQHHWRLEALLAKLAF